MDYKIKKVYEDVLIVKGSKAICINNPIDYLGPETFPQTDGIDPAVIQLVANANAGINQQARVVVEIHDGVAEVTECPAWVSVEIVNHDEEAERAEIAERYGDA